jgi:hypothetical protein
MELSARQAVICAALTGSRGGPLGIWLSPVPEEEILAGAASYLGTEDGLAEAVAALIDEGLFFRVLYPIFSVPVYFCSYASEFLDELPATIGELIADAQSIAALKASWREEWEDNTKEYGPGWMSWGVCHGQGEMNGHSGIEVTDGPCLGPGCFWFTNEHASCEWRLPFANVKRTGWPDTTFLLGIGPPPDIVKASRCLRALQQAAPAFPWPTA